MQIVIGHHTRHQLVFVGPFGVGKTTALRAISDIPVTDTDVASNEALVYGHHASGKSTTTVGFDYGEWQGADGVRVSLVGVPGQERFDAMWDVLMPASSGVVLWLYGDKPDAVDDARFWLEALAARKAVTRLTLAITRIAGDERTLAPFRALATQYHPMATVTVADPRDPAQVAQVVTDTLQTPYAVFEKHQA